MRYRSSVHLDTCGCAKDTARLRYEPGRALWSNSKYYTTMTYIRDLERELRALLEEGDTAKVIRFVKERALESYRNGLDATTQRVEQATEKLERSVRAS